LVGFLAILVQMLWPKNNKLINCKVEDSLHLLRIWTAL